LYGAAQSPFDMALRPFFLTFNTEDPQARHAAVRALRHKLALVGDPDS
jgi:hypothetical protein